MGVPGICLCVGAFYLGFSRLAMAWPSPRLRKAFGDGVWPVPCHGLMAIVSPRDATKDAKCLTPTRNLHMY